MLLQKHIQIMKTTESEYGQKKFFKLIDLDNFEFIVNSGIYD